MKSLLHSVLKKNIMDQCIYQKVSGSKICFLVLYVDDFFACNQ